MPDRTRPPEGALYQSLSVGGHTLELRYGYYEESDRALGEPVVLYPDFSALPLYDPEGRPLVSAVQEPCEHYRPLLAELPEDCCSDCIHYPDTRAEIAVCDCPARRRPDTDS